MLRVLAETYWDLQQTRQGLANRARANAIGGDYIQPLIVAAERNEHEAALVLGRAFKRTSPHLYQWTRDTKGLGAHTMARLLGIIGDPCWAWPHRWSDAVNAGHVCARSCRDGRHLIAGDPYPRAVSQLWAYCGLGDPTRKRRKGMSAGEVAAAGNPRARTICHLIAECAMKSRGVHRPVYDAARERYAAREDWTDAHRHAAALRLTAKAIVRDLWIAGDES